jgi:dihydrofolate reductase
MRKVILYIAMTLDGYIAKKNGDISFLEVVENKGEDYGYTKFIKTINTVIMGRKTFEKVKSFGIPYPHSNINSYIITRNKKPAEENIIFYNGELKLLIGNLKKEKGKDIFVDGGAEVVNGLMKLDLIDEFIISIIPVFLGDGIRLFKNGRPESNLELINTTSYEKGPVVLHYKRIVH